MNAILNAWTNNLWKHGAIDLNQRDAFRQRLNEDREDFGTVVADLDRSVRFMSPRYQTKWRAFVSRNFPEVA